MTHTGLNGIDELSSDTARAAVLCGVGAHLPPAVVTNDDLAARLDTSDDWIRQRTGIRARRVVAVGESTADLAVRAGEAAIMASGGLPPDVVALATTTPDHPCPATAPAVAQRLGLTGAAAYDLNAVCTGFVYGLATVVGLIVAGLAERALLIGADTFSTIVDPDDRGTAVIFGDGAGAVVLRAGRATEPGALSTFELGSDGALAEAVMVRAGGSRHPVAAPPLGPADARLSMAGKVVYRHAVRRMVASSRAVLARTGWGPEQVDRLVAHQANQRILAEVASELGVDSERVVSNLDRVGNTAAASIPLALADALTAGSLRPGQRVLLTAFGGGATWGSTALTWPDLTDRRI